MTNGIIYIAFGRKYVDEVIFSARSVKRTSGLSTTLLTDVEVSDAALDQIIPINPTHKRAKVDFVSHSPYDRTLYLDSDTEVQRDISDLFEVLDRFDVGAVHDHSRKNNRWAKLIPEYDAIPYAFPEFNGGVLLFKRCETVDRFLALWSELFHKHRETTRGLDQASLRMALWGSGVQLHSLPFEYNVRSEAMRRRMEERSRDPDHEGLLKPRIFHWHGLAEKAPFFKRRSPRLRPMAY